MVFKRGHDVIGADEDRPTMPAVITKVPLNSIKDQITCSICKGYFIDATTIIECLHTFCRSCIVRYLETHKYCPVCDVLVHKTKPLTNIRPDKTMQDIVYKLVPRLYQDEMCRRRDFYISHPETTPTILEEKNEALYDYILAPEDNVCISLNYFGSKVLPRYLKCPVAVTVGHLRRLIAGKYDLTEKHHVDVYFNEDCLHSYLTLMEVAYIYNWRKLGPLELTYRIFENRSKRPKLDNDDPNSTNNNNWKEVQLRISENGEISVTGIDDDNHFDEKIPKSPSEKIKTKAKIRNLSKNLSKKNHKNNDVRNVLDERNELRVSETIETGPIQTKSDKENGRNEKKINRCRLKRLNEGENGEGGRKMNRSLNRAGKKHHKVKENLTQNREDPEDDEMENENVRIKIVKENDCESGEKGKKSEKKVGKSVKNDGDEEKRTEGLNLMKKKGSETLKISDGENEEVKSDENKEINEEIKKVQKENSKTENGEETVNNSVGDENEKKEESSDNQIKIGGKVKDKNKNLKEIDKNVKEIDKNVKEIDKNVKKIDKNAKKIEKESKSIKITSKDEHNLNLSKSNQQISLKSSLNQQNQTQINQNQSEINQNQSEINQNQSQLNKNQPQLKPNQSQLNQNQPQSNPNQSQNQPQLNQNQTQINQNQSEINQNQPQLKQNQSQLTQNQSQLTQNQSQSSQNQSQLTQNQSQSSQNQSQSSQNQPQNSPNPSNQTTNLKNKRKLDEKSDFEPQSKQPTILNHTLGLQNLSNNHPLKKHSMTSSSGTSKWVDKPNQPCYSPRTSTYGPIINVPKPQTSTSKVGKNHPQTTILNSKVPIKNKPSTPMGYKTLRDPPRSWNPQLSRPVLNRGGVSGGFVADGKGGGELKNVRPPKFFKIRNNMPRYLGNPASGVKPMYQVHSGATPKDNKDNEKNKIDKDEKKWEKNEKIEKIEKILKIEKIENIKKHSIVKIDPKTLKPISERAPETSNLSRNLLPTDNLTDLKINTSSVSIFNPLKLQQQTSSGSPKSSDRKSPKSPNKILNFTPPNPFVPNLQSPTISPNQYLFPGPFNSYDPRMMAAYHSFLYGQTRLPFHLTTTTTTTTPTAGVKSNFELLPKLQALTAAPSSTSSSMSLSSSTNSSMSPPTSIGLKSNTIKKGKEKGEKSLQNAVEKLTQSKMLLKEKESCLIENKINEKNNINNCGVEENNFNKDKEIVKNGENKNVVDEKKEMVIKNDEEKKIGTIVSEKITEKCGNENLKNKEGK